MKGTFLVLKYMERWLSGKNWKSGQVDGLLLVTLFYL